MSTCRLASWTGLRYLGRVQVELELPVPANPNGVVFATGAATLYADRDWAGLLRLASQVALPLHNESGLPVMMGLSWRAMLDRKNHRQLQGLLYVALDGPATREHLSHLEGTVESLELGFGAPSIERLPPTGAQAVLVTGGQPYALLLKDESGGEPVLRELRWREGRVVPVLTRASGLSLAQLNHFPPAVAVPPAYGHEEQESERMKLAFALGITERILQADGVLDPQEAQWVEELFPPDLTARLGLSDASIRAEYFDAACELLPAALGHHDKLALVGLFFSACFSDGRVDAREMRVLKEAAEKLGLTREEVVKYLQRFW
jgi:uncharacterized tellurite resistance protein B-like protein